MLAWAEVVNICGYVWLSDAAWLLKYKKDGYFFVLSCTILCTLKSVKFIYFLLVEIFCL